ncbi:carbamoyltransferase HypF [Spectribacter hydrogenoxidans]|uniref:Carbamoyltransferase HypF n=1 Tax=Spectribacter hydrogenoxidans TaxID=3075608 RepID=A0ABU3C3Z7_9GAMM|nr:carbamoyltransferase HypF [Salinisphaera sp. W335]MDT0636284.1 carbamoyltransferase HypF [Salinisphaera sp. W335]
MAIRARGLVQGVGFRPTVWRLARECGLAGEVRNDAQGVLIHAWGGRAARARFLERLRTETPPLARIDALECMPLVGETTAADFTIAASAGGEVHTGVAADAATCAACLDEVHDPRDRRHGYAFTNCTHCGPRLSIVTAIPYDRANTSMAGFDLCADCRAEYEDPADRRFHAQPNACSDCGPRLWLEDSEGCEAAAGDDAVRAAAALLRSGAIVAIKGIGGIHLAVDASNDAAVARLRRRKHRHAKPFALMARDVAMIRRYCALADVERQALQSPAAPILLLPANGRERLAEAVAPKQRCYGFMLAYSPLHHLLMGQLDDPIVLTSGNRSEQPQCIGNDEARARLADIADAFLLHDREVVNRVDDSVLRVIAGHPAPIRRARGYAPAPLALPAGFAQAPEVLACGGELKNTFCLLKDGAAILSQHLGDLENAAANHAYRDTLALYLRLFGHRPQALAVDGHPEYLPSKIGREYSEAGGLPLFEVQHHHAHLAACLADNGVALDAPPALGITLDGNGYGDDGSLWGGEFLLAEYRGYRRLASLAPVAMPGAAAAIRQPWRMAYAWLRQTGDWPALAREYGGLAFFSGLADKPLDTLGAMIDAGFNSPVTTSVGRLFDAVAAIAGVCQTTNYEGQAAIELEAAIDGDALREVRGYPLTITTIEGLPRLDPGPLWPALLADVAAGVRTGVIAARFHTGLAHALAAMVTHLAELHGPAITRRVALSGGVFQNAALTETLIGLLECKGWRVLRHERVPANDGGLSLGQAAVAAARSLPPPPREQGKTEAEPQTARRMNQCV